MVTTTKRRSRREARQRGDELRSWHKDHLNATLAEVRVEFPDCSDNQIHNTRANLRSLGLLGSGKVGSGKGPKGKRRGRRRKMAAAPPELLENIQKIEVQEVEETDEPGVDTEHLDAVDKLLKEEQLRSHKLAFSLLEMHEASLAAAYNESLEALRHTRKLIFELL